MTAAKLRSEARRVEATAERRRLRIRRALVGLGVVLGAGAVAAGIAFLPSLDDPRVGTPTIEAEMAEPVAPPPPRPPIQPAADRAPSDPGRAADDPDLSALLADAENFAAGREGEIAFALVDGDSGVRGRGETTQFQSASVVKSMLLAAELRRLDDEGLPLDSATESLLTSMITISDNDAATAIYSRVGDDGLNAVAQRTGMKDFEVAISWGYAQITAADMARLFAQLDRIIPEPLRGVRQGPARLGHRPSRAGGSRPLPKDWSVRFKGGWIVTDSPGSSSARRPSCDAAGGAGDRDPHRRPALDGLRDRDGRGDHRPAARATEQPAGLRRSRRSAPRSTGIRTGASPPGSGAIFDSYAP